MPNLTNPAYHFKRIGLEAGPLLGADKHRLHCSASFYRGGDGPLTTQMTRFSDPLVEAFGASGRAAGYQSTPDYNGAQQEGFGVWQMTVKDGRARWSCAAASSTRRNC